MFKKIFTIIKKIVYSSFFLYGYNILALPLNLVIPINVITVGLVILFGFPVLFSLILILILIF